MNDSIKEFRAAIARFKGYWNQLDVKTLYAKKDNIYINLITSIGLEYVKKPQNIVKKKYEFSDKLIALHTKFELWRLNPLLHSLIHGKICIPGYEILFGKSKELDLDRTIYYSYKKILINTQYYLRQNPYTNFIIESNAGEPIRKICKISQIEDINDEIRKFEKPYEDFDDFTHDFFGFYLQRRASGYVADMNTFCIIAAPVKVFLTKKCNLTSEKLQLEIAAELPKKPKDIRIRLISHSYKNQSHRTNFPILYSQWKKLDNYYIFVKNFALGDSRYVKLFLEGNNELLHEMEIENPELRTENVRSSMHALFDPGLEIIENFVHGTGKKRQLDFETGVAWLLHLCGLNIISYGTNKTTQDNVDLVAFSPSGEEIMVIECTTYLPDIKGKLAKLHQRAMKMQKILPQHSLIPIMFTSLPYDEIPPQDFENAQSMDINILTRNVIDTLLKICCKPYPTKATLELVRTSIFPFGFS